MVIKSPLLLILLAVFLFSFHAIKAICSNVPEATAEQLKFGVLIITLKDSVNFITPKARRLLLRQNGQTDTNKWTEGNTLIDDCNHLVCTPPVFDFSIRLEILCPLGFDQCYCSQMESRMSKLHKKCRWIGLPRRIDPELTVETPLWQSGTSGALSYVECY